MSRLRPLITRLICQFPLLSDNHILMSTGERLDHPPNLSISIIGLMGDRKGRPGVDPYLLAQCPGVLFAALLLSVRTRGYTGKRVRSGRQSAAQASTPGRYANDYYC